MKIRSGFVSNSSSSSFIIGHDKKLKSAKLKEKLINVFGVNEKSPLYNTSLSIIESLLNCSEEMTKAEVMADWGVDDDDFDMITDGEIYKDIFDKKFICRSGSVANDSEESSEMMLVDMSLDYKDDELIIYKEGGY